MAENISLPINNNVVQSDLNSSSTFFKNILDKEIEERIKEKKLFRNDATHSIQSAENLAKAISKKSQSLDITIRYYLIEPQVDLKRITYIIFVSQDNIPDFLAFDQLPEVLVVRGKTPELIQQHCDEYILNAREANHYNI